MNFFNQNYFSFHHFRKLTETFFLSGQNFPASFSKLHSTCPEQYLEEKISEKNDNFCQFRIMSDI